MKKLKIDNKIVGDGEPAFIIAEAGINHQGQLEIAKKLIDVAVMAGADAVKFQKRKIERTLTKEFLEKPYTGYNSFGATYGEHRKALELSEDDFRKLKRYCAEKQIIFMASAWDEESADFLEELRVPAYKIASADLTNIPLIEHVAKKEKPIIMSTGMSNMDEIEAAVNTIKKYTDQLILLQCTSTYPSRFEEINLRVMKTFREKFNVLVGYSGHEYGIVIPPVAVVLGACVVERHFTLDRTMKGGDHAASLEPVGLQRVVRDIRHVEQALGIAEKRILESEISIRQKLAKSIVSKIKIPKGSIITKDMLATKGPGTGISPIDMDKVIGKRVSVDIEEDSVINWGDIY